MAAMPDRIPVPPFPRWTGMRATVGPCHGDKLAVILTIPPLTRRARLWMACRVLAAKGASDAAPRH